MIKNNKPDGYELINYNIGYSYEIKCIIIYSMHNNTICQTSKNKKK